MASARSTAAAPPAPNRKRPAPPDAGRSEERRARRTRATYRSATLLAGLSGGLLLMLAVFAAYHRSVSWVEHTHEVLRTVQRIQSSLADAEAGQRGYLLTHDDRHLAPYHAGQDDLPALLDRAGALTADNPSQQENVRRLRRLVEAKLDKLAQTLSQAAGDGLDRALATVREGSGERLTSEIRDRIALVQAEEDALLAVRGGWAGALAAVMVVFTVAFPVVSFCAVRATLRRLHEDYEAERQEGEALAAALERNATLLDEVNHRVKNSLQVVSNLLRMQALRAHNPAVHEQLLDSSRRVEAIAEVHQRLYGTDTYDTVELTDLLACIARGAAPVAGTDEPAVELAMPERLTLMVGDAIPVALIVNELLTNVYKHAFPAGRPGTVRLRVAQRADELRIDVEDDGAGLPPGLESGRADSFGLGMVRALAGQLGGALEVRRTDPGTRFTLRMPRAGEACGA